MASILDLPTELLDTIIDLALWNGGFESLMLSCKAVFKSGKSQIAQYNALLQKWEAIALNERNTVELLEAIDQTPIVLQLIRSLDLHSYDVYALLDDKLIARAKDLAVDLYDVSMTGHDADGQPTCLLRWSNTGEELGSIDTSDGPSPNYRLLDLLLSLCTNLRSLTLPEQWAAFVGEDDLKAAVLAVARHGEPGSIEGHMPLAKLEDILLTPEPDYDVNPRLNLSSMAALLSLPGLRKASISNAIAVNDGYTGIPFKWPFDELESNITRLELPGGCIDADGVAEIVRHCPRLTNLSYDHYTKWHGCLHDWDAGAFVAAVEEHCATRLKSLSITTGCLYGEVETSVKSLTSFINLKQLQCNVRVFAAPPSGSGERLSDISPTSTKWAIEDVPSLSSILPAQIEEADLLFDEYEGSIPAIRRLFSDPVALKSKDKFPQFKRLSVTQVAQDEFPTLESAELLSLREVVESAGGELILGEPEEAEE